MPIGKKTAAPDPLAAAFAKLDVVLASLAALRHTYSAVFESLSELNDEADGLRDKIKGILATKYKGQPTGIVTVFTGQNVLVTVAPSNARQFDSAGMLARHRALLVELGAIEHMPAVPEHDVVSLKVIDDAVRNKIVDKDLVAPFITYGEAKTPAVSFKLPQPNKES